MGKYAILDIGTNSVKYLLFSIENGKPTTIFDTNTISRLGEGLLKTGVISDEAMNRNIEVLRGFQKNAEDQGVSELMAVGTMCLRAAKNSDLFLKKAKDELGLNIKVISGEEEARLSFLAVLPNIDKRYQSVVIFDIGGGSTEFIIVKPDEVNSCVSINLGVVSVTERFMLSNPVTDYEMENMRDYVSRSFIERISGVKPDFMIGIGGTVTTMCAVMRKMKEYNPSIIQGSEITLDEVRKQIKLYQSKTIEERKQIPGLKPKRSDVILSGAGITETVMKIFNMDSFTVSARGMRHGLMFDRYLR